MDKRNSVPSEHEEQSNLFRWREVMAAKHPELRLMFAIPNAAKRTPQLAAYMKAEGLRSGVPDICLPVPRDNWHGMFIELKRAQGGRIAPEQEQWLSALIEHGYYAIVCKGWQEASNAIEKYLGVGQ